ncbi:hypothetical protein O0L34_g11467 [Tuta absoluta]|nr:hypothetical protein O0L34_g11467 [Tuta absoluta]
MLLNAIDTILGKPHPLALHFTSVRDLVSRTERRATPERTISMSALDQLRCARARGSVGEGTRGVRRDFGSVECGKIVARGYQPRPAVGWSPVGTRLDGVARPECARSTSAH